MKTRLARRHIDRQVPPSEGIAAMPHVTNSIDINASPEKVWAVLGDLTTTGDWLPGVVSTSLDGTTRICVMADGSEIHEQISDHDDQQRTYRFRHLRTPLPVRGLHGRFTVTDGAAGAALVTLDTDVDPADPDTADDLTTMIKEAFGQSLTSLRRWIETRQRWDGA
jgi:uncharacterized protein YndB with AHSA1/START domain